MKTLRPFQMIGVKFLEAKGGRALIADEMGLGKTAQALSWLQTRPELRPALVLCPASVKLNWQREASFWMNTRRSCGVLSGRDGRTPPRKDIYIINYDILQGWLPVLLKAGIQVLIVDECHNLRNRSAKRTKAFQKLAVNIPHVIALSGTPIVNKPVEFFPVLNALAPRVFPSFWRFAEIYCGLKHTRFGWDFNGATNTAELHKVLRRTLMIRRKQSEVLTELPPTVHSVVPLEIDNRREYERARVDLLKWLAEQDAERAERASRAEQIVKVEVLKQLAVTGKMIQAICWVEDFLRGCEEKLILFATHTAVLDALGFQFPSIHVRLDGGTSAAERDAVVREFQSNKKARLFLGNIKAAGEGITLTAASKVAFLEYPWTPSAVDQAIGRVRRIGQQAGSVNAYYLVAENTVEGDILSVLDEKRTTLGAILDGHKVDSDSMIGEVVKRLRQDVKNESSVPPYEKGRAKGS